MTLHGRGVVAVGVDESWIAAARRRSAAIFGNEKMAEAIVYLDRHKMATAQQVARDGNYGHTLARVVLLRLEGADLVTSVRDGLGTRAPRNFLPRQTKMWEDVAQIADRILREASGEETGESSRAETAQPRGAES